MAGFNYGRARNTALRLIDKFGQQGAVRRQEPGGGSPWDPGEPTIVDHSCLLAVTSYDASEIDGTLIRRDDRKVLVAAEGLAVTPNRADQIMVQGVALEIVTVSTLSPAGTAVLYTIQARG